MRTVLAALVITLSASALSPLLAAEPSNPSGNWPEWAKKALSPRGR